MIEDTLNAFSAFEKQKEEILASQTALFANLFTEFFQAAPEVEKICWRQYTPSFNDGDPCLFTLGDPAFFSAKALVTEGVIVGIEEDEGYDDDDDDEEGDIDIGIFDQFDNCQRYANDSEHRNRDYFAKQLVEVQKTIDAMSERDREVRSLCAKIARVLHQNQDVLEDAYGDGVKVVVTKSGVETTEYDCGY